MGRSDSFRVRWRWRDLPLRGKGIVIVAIPVVPLVFSAYFLYSTQHRTREAEAAVARTRQIRTLLDRTLIAVGDAEVSARHFTTTRDRQALDSYRRASGRLATALTEAARLITDGAQKERLRQMLLHAQGRPLGTLVDFTQKSEPGTPVPVDLLARSRAAMARVQDDLREMEAAEDTLLAAREAEARQAQRRLLIVMAIGAGGLVGGVAIALVFMTGLARRIGVATANAERLAAGEPLWAAPAGNDEIGALADALTRTSALLQARDAELQTRLDEVAEANKELEAFSYSVSHDLRAPLRHIAGFASLLQKRAAEQLDDEGRRYLQTIAGSAARMGRLVDDLLSFSRMGRAEMLRHQVNLNDLVKDVVQEAAQDAGGRTIQWQTHALPPVSGDRAMLRVALSNLVSNAVKYTATRPVAQIEIGAHAKENGERVVFVRDNGVGFDMAYADKLFGVFQRLHGNDEFEGTGIGLANVRRIVQRHGGRTWAEGAVDRGATFFIALPV